MRADWLKRALNARTTARDPFHFWLYISVDPVVVIADIAAADRSLESQVAFTSAQFAGFAIGWIWFFIAKWLIKKAGFGDHPYWWLVALFGASVTFVTDQAVGVIRFGPQILFTLHQSMFLVIAIGILLAVGVALLLGAATKYEQLREGLISERTRKAQLKSDSLPEVQAFLAHAKESIEQTKDKDPKEIAREIRDLVDLRLRPISHAIWQSEAKKLRRFSIGLLTREISAQPVRLAYIPAGFVVLIANRYFVTEFGFFEGWLRLSLIFGLVWMLPTLHQYLFKNFSWVARLGVSSFPISVLLASTAAYLLPVQLMGLPDGLRPFSYFVTSTLAIALPSIVSSVIATTKDLLQQQREQLREETGRYIGDQAEFVLATTRARDTANYLHGTTQNRLLAAALMLENANDKQTVASQLAAIEQTLQDVLNEPKQFGDLVVQLESLKKSWQGMLSIEYKIELEKELDAASTELVALCIREAASNAFRHGHAKNLSVKLEIQGSKRLLRIIDDGIGPRSPRPGLGSKLFDSAGRWKLAAKESGGTELVIELRQK